MQSESDLRQKLYLRHISGKIDSQVNKYKTKVPSKFQSSIVEDESEDENPNVKLTQSNIHLPPLSKPSNTSLSTRFQSSSLVKQAQYEPLNVKLNTETDIKPRQHFRKVSLFTDRQITVQDIFTIDENEFDLKKYKVEPKLTSRFHRKRFSEQI